METATLKSHELYQEVLNTLTHLLGVLLSIIGVIYLIETAFMYGDALKIVSSILYGFSLIMMFVTSSAYHGSKAINKTKHSHKFKIGDHCAIYLLIAGSYTPFSLVVLNGPYGWTLFGVSWGIATIGLVFKMFFTGKYVILSTLAYVFMGWLIVFVVKPLLAVLPTGGIMLLIYGGLAYSIGAVFYILGSKNGYYHVLWHLFVIAGGAFHFVAVYMYVLPN